MNEYDIDENLKLIESILRSTCDGDGYMDLLSLMATARALAFDKAEVSLQAFKDDLLSVKNDFTKEQSCSIFEKMNKVSVLAPCLKERNQIEKLKKESSELTESKTKLTIEIDSLKKERDQFQTEKENLAQKNTSLLSEKDSLSSQLDKLTQEKNQLSSAHSDLCDNCNQEFSDMGLEYRIDCLI